MRCEQFDADVFDTAAGYVLPKMLGCFGIGVVATVVLVIIILLAQDVEWLGPPLAVLAFVVFIPGIVYASLRFDDRHNARQRAKKKGL